VSFFAHASQRIQDGLGGTSSGTDATIDALFSVYVGKVICDGDRFCGAFLGADTATNAGMLAAAGCFCFRAFGFGGAVDMHYLVDWVYRYQLAGTGGYTGTTAGALIAIYVAHAIFVHVDGVK
jgi:bacillopeptidase F (M6 metalloprotease family)